MSKINDTIRPATISDAEDWEQMRRQLLWPSEKGEPKDEIAAFFFS